MSLHGRTFSSRLCRRSVGFCAVVLGAAAAVLPAPGNAQYFGRNKVLWESFEFEVLETDHFVIHYYPPGSPTGDYVGQLAERWYERLSLFFDHELEERIPIVVYRDHADFQQTVVTSGLIGEGTGGFTESVRNRVVLPLTGINADNDHVIGHELAHAFQFHLLKERASATRQAQPTQVPLWVVEGLAEYLSEGRHDPATAIWMRDAVLFERLPEQEKLFQLQLSPYQYGQAIWAYIAGVRNDDVARQFFLRSISAGVESAIDAYLRTDRRQFFEDFHAALQDFYGPIMAERQSVDEVAVPLLDAASTGTSVNYAPSISPDGRWLAFLSARDMDIDLYLADAGTGRVLRKLVSAESDPHFDYLSYLDSSAAWSPDSTRLAFSVFAGGERKLAIFDVARGQVERQIDLPGIAGMRQPAWSPDGARLAFSATSGAASDLYVVDLASGELTQLTNDSYSEIQPSFSPDGTRIVFATDRGPATDLARLDFGDLQLAVLTLESRSIEPLVVFPRGKHINPQFSPDGKRIYFIGDPLGVPDLFAYDLGERRGYPLTSLKTGITGITSGSPAMSVSSGTGDIVFSAMVNGDWNVYRLESSRSESASAEMIDADAGLLPPAEAAARPGLVESYLGDPGLGFARAHGRRYTYAPAVELANVGPAAISVGTSSYGTQANSALSLYFDDMLNRHQIALTVQGGTTYGGLLDFEDTFGAEALYLNQTRRLKWGASASRIPYLYTAAYGERGTVDIDGTPVPADIYYRLIQVVKETDASLVGHYPLSVNNRIEAGVGLARIDFERELERVVFPDTGGAYRDEQGLAGSPALDLRRVSAAFVRDTSRFGFVSPAMGTRFRFESEWTSGDLAFQTTTLDYRRYFLREPFTIALRALHIGRRGSDAEDPRLTPLDIGRASLVRGYEFDSFDVAECTFTPGIDDCPEFDRLIGSRIGVLNAELRLAILGSEDFGIYNVPYAPTEAVFFVDIGAAWSSNESVDWRFDRSTTARVPVVSAGIALRTLVLGALPLEFYYAYPYQRPEEGAVFGFRIGIGW